MPKRGASARVSDDTAPKISEWVDAVLGLRLRPSTGEGQVLGLDVPEVLEAAGLSRCTVRAARNGVYAMGLTDGSVVHGLG